MLYQELLEFGRPKIDEFFSNVELFENQLQWRDFNSECYQLMYLENKYPETRTVKELKEQIGDLKATCRACGNYFMKRRNNSVVKLDVMLGQLFENIMIDFLNSKGIKAMHGDVSNKKYPDCMVLGRDKGIIAYFEVKYHGAPFLSAINKIGRYCYEGSATMDFNKLLKQLEIIESDIDRPVFYLHWIDYPCLKGVFFETSEQVKDYIYHPDNLFEREMRTGDESKNPQSIYLKKVYAPLLYMGTFEEFIDKLKELR